MANPSAAFTQTFNIFEGVVRLPQDRLASGDELITLTATGSQFSNPTVFSFPIVVPVGASEGAFAFSLDASQTGGFWSLSIDCQQCANGIVTDPHYPTTATGNPLTLATASRFFYLAGQDFRSLELTFIANTPPANVDAASLVPLIDLLLNSDGSDTESLVQAESADQPEGSLSPADE